MLRPGQAQQIQLLRQLQAEQEEEAAQQAVTAPPASLRRDLNAMDLCCVALADAADLLRCPGDGVNQERREAQDE